MSLKLNYNSTDIQKIIVTLSESMPNSLKSETGLTYTFRFYHEQSDTYTKVDLVDNSIVPFRYNSFDVILGSSINIGDIFRGGKLFYKNGSHYYLSSTPITSTKEYATTYVDDTTQIDIGEGANNTDKIINTQGFLDTNAAYACKSLIITSGTSVYDDWYLPSILELSEIYTNKTLLGIPNSIYISSSQQDINTAYSIDFTDGTYYTLAKNTGMYYIPCRTQEVINVEYPGWYKYEVSYGTLVLEFGKMYLDNGKETTNTYDQTKTKYVYKK